MLHNKKYHSTPYLFFLQKLFSFLLGTFGLQHSQLGGMAATHTGKGNNELTCSKVPQTHCRGGRDFFSPSTAAPRPCFGEMSGGGRRCAVAAAAAVARLPRRPCSSAATAPMTRAAWRRKEPPPPRRLKGGWGKKRPRRRTLSRPPPLRLRRPPPPLGGRPGGGEWSSRARS